MTMSDSNMYYQSTIQIVDRGDSPALEVLDRNARSLAQRAADETKDELQKVMSRVNNIYGTFESFNATESAMNSSLEYVDGIQELEEILKDHIKKNKYKQQITIFIVGYQDVCQQKLVLLQQVNEFFMTNAKNFGKEDWSDPTPEVDLDEVSTKIEDSLNTAEELTGRLAEINKEMVSYLTSYAVHKGSHKAKKKLDKTLQQAKDDINGLTEKLVAAQTELDEKEEKISTLMKQAEIKHMEIQRYKTAAEVAKKSIRDTDRLQEEFDRRGSLLQEYERKIESLQLEVTQTSLSKAKSEEQFSSSGQDHLNKIAELEELVTQKQVALEEAKRDLQKLHDMQILSMQQAHRREMNELKKQHAAELKQLTKELRESKKRIKELERAQGEVEGYKEKLEFLESMRVTDSQPSEEAPADPEGDPSREGVTDPGEPSVTDVGDPSLADIADQPDLTDPAVTELPDDQSTTGKVSRASSKDETRSTGKDTQRSKSQASASSKKSTASSSKKGSKTPVKQKTETATGETVYEGKACKEYAEAAVQDEGGGPDTATVSIHELGMVREDTGDFSNAYDLKDDQSWAGVPQEQTTGRFIQYRKLTRKRLAELEEQLATTVTKTHKKVDTLKSQFKEHKSKWEAERKVLVQQIEQSIRLQSEAENEADAAMSQLEDFIIEQEKLENLEDQKQLELSRHTTKLAEEAQAELAGQGDEPEQSTETPSGRTSAVKGDNTDDTPEITSHPEVMETKDESAGDENPEGVADGRADKQTDDHAGSERPSSGVKDGEPELTQLLQQTDDAKVQELRRSATTLSAAPTIETPQEEGSSQRSLSAQEAPQSTLEIIVQNIEKMMSNEARLEPQQTKALRAVRNAVKEATNEKRLSAIKSAQTLAVISLAAQLAEESLRLHIKPSCFFNLFGKLNMDALEDAEIRMSETKTLRASAEHGAKLSEVNSTEKDQQQETEEQGEQASIDATEIMLAVPSDSQDLAVPSDSLQISGDPQASSIPTVVLSAPLGASETHTSAVHVLTGASLGMLPNVEAPGADVMPRKVTSNLAPCDLEMVDVCTQWDERDAGLAITPDSTEPTAFDGFSVSGMTNEEIRNLSSKSRASLRSQYKTRLEERKLAIEDRRSKSPAISIPSLHSLEDDQLIDDDDELELPLPEERKDGVQSVTAEKGTSPPSARQEKPVSASPATQPPCQAPTPAERAPSTPHRAPSSIRGDHPIVQEYLDTYGGVVSFKEDLTSMLVDKDMLTASQVLSDLEAVLFDQRHPVEPQLRKMTKNLHYILDELTSLLESVLINEREPVVSSLVNLSRDQTGTNLVTREKSEDSVPALGSARSRSALSRHSDKCLSCESEVVRELRETCTLLQSELDLQAKKHEEQMRHNSTLMMEMQETIRELQRELAALTKEKEPSPEPSIMFTRLDSERNAKIMKRALYEDRLDTGKYKEAVQQMDQYVSLPAQRLAQLARKYMHHTRMRQIEENVRHSKSLNENVFEILDKMEDLQNKRAKQWTDNMDALGVERYRLAGLLMETFDNIEQESGIFLIKPIYSFKGRDFKDKYGGKLSRLNRPTREPSPAREGCRSAMAPAPTPATNTRPGTRVSYHGRLNQSQSETALFARHAQFEPTTGVSGLGMTWTGAQPRPVWNLNNSQAKDLSEDNLTSYANQTFNTPRILELDINRMLIGQNNVSSRMRASLTDDRLQNAANNSVRSYVTVNRPTVAPGQIRFHTEGAVPPSTPHRPGSSGERRRSQQDRRRLLGSPPLPPIHHSQGPSAGKLMDVRSQSELSFPPNSPPGSSLRYTPPLREQELRSPLDAFA